MAKAKETPKPKAAVPKKPVKAAKKPPNADTPKKEETPPKKEYYCSFCRKSSEHARRLIAGPNNIFICDECVSVCVAILYEDDKDFWSAHLKKIIAGKKSFKVEDVQEPKEGNKK